MEALIACALLLYVLHILTRCMPGLRGGIGIFAVCLALSRLVGRGILACLCLSGLLVNRRR